MAAKEELLHRKIALKKQTIGHLKDKAGRYRFDLYEGKKRKDSADKTGTVYFSLVR